jgi:hypothetical protein
MSEELRRQAEALREALSRQEEAEIARRTAADAARRAAGVANSSLEVLAGGAERLAADELPALRRLLSERIRAQEMQAVGAAGNLTEEADGLCRAVARVADGLAGAMGAPLQRAAARREAVVRVSNETAARVREEVDAASAGLLKEVSELAERLRQSEEVCLSACARSCTRTSARIKGT